MKDGVFFTVRTLTGRGHGAKGPDTFLGDALLEEGLVDHQHKKCKWRNAQKSASKNSPSSLHAAAMLGDLNKVTELLKTGGQNNIDNGDRRRWSPLHHACAHGHISVATALLEAGAQTALLNDSGYTACAPHSH